MLPTLTNSNIYEEEYRGKMPASMPFMTHRSIGCKRILEIQRLPVPDNNINKDVQERY